MSQTETSKTQVSRRTLAKGAAWSVPVIATAAAAPAASASVVPGQSAVSDLAYTCNAVAHTSFGDVPQGPFAWTADITATTPTSVAPGDSIPAPTITANVTTDTSSADTLRQLGVTRVTGTSAASYAVAGDVVGAGARTGSLSVPPTDVPASGPIVTVASGPGVEETAGSGTGVITSTVGNFTVELTTTGGTIVQGLSVTCTLDTGQAADLVPSIQVK